MRNVVVLYDHTHEHTQRGQGRRRRKCDVMCSMLGAQHVAWHNVCARVRTLVLSETYRAALTGHELFMQREILTYFQRIPLHREDVDIRKTPICRYATLRTAVLHLGLDVVGTDAHFLLQRLKLVPRL